SELHGALPAGHGQEVVEHGAGRSLPFGEDRAQNLDALALAVLLDLEPGAGIGREPANMIVDLLRRSRPVDARLGVADLGGRGEGAFGWRRAVGLSVLELRQRMADHGPALVATRIVQLAGRHVRPGLDTSGEAGGARV